MKIGPTDNTNRQPDGHSGPLKRVEKEPDKISGNGDGLEISGEARELQENGENNSERLREIKNRVERGFYSRPKIAEKIAEKLSGDDIIEIDYLKAVEPELFKGIEDDAVETDQTDEDPNGEE